MNIGKKIFTSLSIGRFVVDPLKQNVKIILFSNDVQDDKSSQNGDVLISPASDSTFRLQENSSIYDSNYKIFENFKDNQSIKNLITGYIKWKKRQI